MLSYQVNIFVQVQVVVKQGVWRTDKQTDTTEKNIDADTTWNLLMCKMKPIKFLNNFNVVFLLEHILQWVLLLFEWCHCTMSHKHSHSYQNTYVTNNNLMVTIYMKNMDKFRSWKCLVANLHLDNPVITNTILLIVILKYTN